MEKCNEWGARVKLRLLSMFSVKPVGTPLRAEFATDVFAEIDGSFILENYILRAYFGYILQIDYQCLAGLIKAFVRQKLRDGFCKGYPDCYALDNHIIDKMICERTLA